MSNYSVFRAAPRFLGGVGVSIRGHDGKWRDVKLADVPAEPFYVMTETERRAANAELASLQARVAKYERRAAAQKASHDRRKAKATQPS